MKKSATVVAAYLLLAFASASGAAEWIIEGRVVALSDGDTITVLISDKTQHKVRIAGIDAPEKNQPFGNASRENLSKLVYNRRVEVRCYKRDRYGREVCRVYEGQRDVGLEQVRAGMAWHFKEYMHEQATQERLAYLGEEEAAKAAKRGLWKEPQPVPPWEFRQRR